MYRVIAYRDAGVVLRGVRPFDDGVCPEVQQIEYGGALTVSD
jgi:hypothetical protein